MNTLFGEENEFCKIKTGMEYHQFNPAVIASYYNIDKYPVIFNTDYIAVNRRKECAVFLLQNKFVELNSNKKKRYYSIDKINKKSAKHDEYLYCLKDIFLCPSYDIRRGIKLKERSEVQIVELVDKEQLNKLILKWDTIKKSDPKVYKLLFDSKRYARTFELKNKGFNIYQKAILIKKQLYAIISFSIEENIAFELAFISEYNNKELKIINDLNQCIIINCFYDLYKNYNIQYINPGTDAGIKGLKIFKSKLPNKKISYYSFIAN